MIYLDSAATTLRKPPSVARACAYAVDHLATPGRGGHRPAMAAAETAFACRREAAALFDGPEPDRAGRRPPSLTCPSRTGWSLPSTPPTA